MHPSRDRILEAAARVYSQHGFRGATTRRIADEAGVNEITLFRQFGSKDALINEAVRTSSMSGALPLLPAAPLDPEAELTEWATMFTAHIASQRSLIRRTISEIEERPEAVPCASEAPLGAKRQLCAYVARMREQGVVAAPAATDPDEQSSWDAAAVTMLMNALFSDAMGRDVMPEMYTLAAERAPAMYVRIFLRAIGIGEAPHHAAAPARADANGTHGTTSTAIP